MYPFSGQIEEKELAPYLTNLPKWVHFRCNMGQLQFSDNDLCLVNCVRDKDEEMGYVRTMEVGNGRKIEKGGESEKSAEVGFEKAGQFSQEFVPTKDQEIPLEFCHSIQIRDEFMSWKFALKTRGKECQNKTKTEE